MTALRIAVSTLLLGTFLSACGDEISEPAGSADYFIENASATDLLVDFDSLGAAAQSALPISIAAGQTAQIGRDGAIGINPKPTDSFQSMQIFIGTSSTSTTTKQVYQQNPMEDARWTGGRTDSGDYGHSEWTLRLEDADLDL